VLKLLSQLKTHYWSMNQWIC